jgi:putative sterol carrier protein
MVEDIFASLNGLFVEGAVAKPITFYFSLGDTKKTVELSPDSFAVSDGKVVDSADCVCKTSPEFFVKIWEEDYRPGMKDFLSGTIKSNNPNALQEFLRGFGKPS